jgi:hypothetical protein
MIKTLMIEIRECVTWGVIMMVDDGYARFTHLL